MPDNAPLHLLDALTEHQGFETAVYCTYGVDLAFFEEAVLRPLRQNRCRRHIIFVDSKRYADTIEQWHDCAHFVGQQYLLVPAHLPPFQAFHPKFTLLIGPQRGRLLLGSGNLTFTGFGHNHELYNCLDWTPEQPDNAPLFQAAWQFVESVQAKWGHNRLVTEALRKTTYQTLWLHQPTADQPNHFAFWHNLQTPLLDQLEHAVGDDAVQRIIIVTPFLDNQATAVSELHRRFQPAEMCLVLQNNKAVGDMAALLALQAQDVPLALYSFGDNDRYLHAKLLLLETETAVYALSGSANCTRPALLATPETHGNVETTFLHRANSPDYFRYLLPDDLLSTHQVSASEINLRPHDRPKADENEETAVPFVQLLDLRLEQGILHLQLHWKKSAPTTITGWQLQLDTAPPVHLPLELDNKQEETTVPLRTEWGDLFMQPVSGKFVGFSKDGDSVEIASNPLWVSNVAALASATSARWVGSDIAGDVLAAMAAESDAEWRELYAEIQRLVLLDVAQISQRATKATGSADHKTAVSLLPAEQETHITLAKTESTLGLNGEEVVATAVSRESELQAFFDYIRQRLPGTPPSSQASSPSNSITHRPAKRKWTPDRRTKTRFVNLVKKYIASLQNPIFRQQTAIRDSLIYYTIFQRIVWLLHTHQGLDIADCLIYWRVINNGFFGVNSPEPPVTSPLHRHLCRYAWGDDWLETAVPLYALTNLWQMEQALAQQPDPTSHQWDAEKWRLLAFLRVVVDWDHLRQVLEALTPLEEVAQLYDLPADDLALALLPLLDSGTAEIADILQRWTAVVAFDPKEITDPQQAALLYQANVDCRRALFCLYDQMSESARQQQTAKELAFWTRRTGANEESHQWRAKLIALVRENGTEKEVAEALYHRAHQYFRDGEYALAKSLAQEALTIAERLCDETHSQRCCQLLNHIAYFVR